MNGTSAKPGLDTSPPAPGAVPPVDRARLDGAVAAVRTTAGVWAVLPAEAKATLLGRVIKDTVDAAGEWVAAAAAAKRLDVDGQAASEEWLAGPYPLIRHARLLRRSLRHLSNYGVPRLPAPARTGPDGRLRVRVFPTDMWDRLVLPGTTAEVQMLPGVTAGSMQAPARLHRYPPGGGEAAGPGGGVAAAAGGGVALARRRQLRRDLAQGRAPPALRRQPDRRREDQSGQRLPAAPGRTVPCRPGRARLRAFRGRRCRGRRIPVLRPRHRHDPHHRLARDLRSRRLRPRARPSGPQAAQRACAGHPGHRRAGQRVAGHRRPGPVVGFRPRLPERAHRLDGGEQRRVQLRHAAGARDAGGLAAAGGTAGQAAQRAATGAGPPPVLPRGRRALPRLPRSAPGGLAR